MKPLKYRGYRINRIDRYGIRRVTIFTGNKTTFLHAFDGYDMKDLVKKAKKWIDSKEEPMVVEVPVREIKFRMWDGEKFGFCQFDYNLRLSPRGNCFIPLVFDGAHVSDIDKDVIILQQFTGIKDSKGKEIYEGDLVVSDKETGIHEIKWEKESASFTVGDDLWPNAKLTIVGNNIENHSLIS